MPITAIEFTGTGSTTALLRLITWLSPAFPVGAFAYSGGLEQAAQDGLIDGDEGLAAWIGSLMGQGTGWNDAVLLVESYRTCRDPARLAEVAALAAALAGSAERHRETLLLGHAFLEAASAWPNVAAVGLEGEIAYPVAVGAVAGVHGIGIEATVAAFLQASASTLVSVAIRCGITGQKGGTKVLAGLEGQIGAIAARAAQSSLDDLGSATVLADIASLRHETMHSRLFRS